MQRTTCVALTVCLLLTGAGSTVAQDAETARGVRVIQLNANWAVLFTQDGEEIHDIPVVPGETVRFRIDNTAGFPNSFYIGSDEELLEPNATTEVGIPEWSNGVKEVIWVVPDDISGLRFGSTVPGHYERMYGCFSVGQVGPGGALEQIAQAEPCPLPGESPAWSDPRIRPRRAHRGARSPVRRDGPVALATSGRSRAGRPELLGAGDTLRRLRRLHGQYPSGATVRVRLGTSGCGRGRTRHPGAHPRRRTGAADGLR